jgi:hypothetical protein
MTGTLMDNTLVETLCLDYITLVSERLATIQWLFRKVTDALEEPFRGNIGAMGRSYVSVGGIMAGPAPRSKAETKWVIQVPGLSAETAAYHAPATDEVVHCSRFDLQCTIPVNDAPDIHSLYRILSQPEVYPWNQRGKTPVVTHITNTQGGETLYIGKRSSDMMQRFYLKTIEGFPYLRWEMEVKGRLARSLAREGILHDRDMRATLARSVIAGMPDKIQHYMEPFYELLPQGTGELKRSGYEASDEATLRWLRETAIPALKRAMQGRYQDEVIAALIDAGIPLATRVEQAHLDRKNNRVYDKANGNREKD